MFHELYVVLLAIAVAVLLLVALLEAWIYLRRPAPPAVSRIVWRNPEDGP